MAFPGERWYLHLGTWFGISITLHCTFFLLLACQIVLASAKHHVSIYTWSTFLLYGPIFFVSILTHGLSHAFRIKRLGGHCQGLLLWPLGSMSTYQPANDSVLEDLWMALLGISSFIPHLVLWITVVITVAPTGPEYWISKPPDIDTLDDVEQVRDWIAALARRAIVLNFVLMLCNASIPAYPLDASLGLTSMLVHRGKDSPTAASIVGVGGVVVGVGLIVYTTIVMEYLSQIPDIRYILIIIFILVSSGILLYMKNAGMTYQHPLFSRECYKIADGVPTLSTTAVPKSRRTCKARAMTDDSMSCDLEAGGNSSEDDDQLLSSAFNKSAVQNGQWEQCTPVNGKRKRCSALQMDSLPFLGDPSMDPATKPNSPSNQLGSPVKEAYEVNQPSPKSASKNAAQTSPKSGNAVDNASRMAPPREPLEVIEPRHDSKKLKEKWTTIFRTSASPKAPSINEPSSVGPAVNQSTRETSPKRGSIKNFFMEKSSDTSVPADFCALADSSTTSSPNFTPPQSDNKLSKSRSPVLQSPRGTSRSSSAWRPLQFPSTLASSQKVEFISPRPRSPSLAHKRKIPLLPVSGHENPAEVKGGNGASPPTTFTSSTKQEKRRREKKSDTSGEKSLQKGALPPPPLLADSSTFNRGFRVQNVEGGSSNGPNAGKSSRGSKPTAPSDKTKTPQTSLKAGDIKPSQKHQLDRSPADTPKPSSQTPSTPRGSSSGKRLRKAGDIKLPSQKTQSLSKAPKAELQTPSTPRRARSPSPLRSPRKTKPPQSHSLPRMAKAELQSPSTPRRASTARPAMELPPVSGHDSGVLSYTKEADASIRSPSDKQSHVSPRVHLSDDGAKVWRSLQSGPQGVATPGSSYSSPLRGSRSTTPIRSRHALVFPNLYKSNDGQTYTKKRESKSTGEQSPSHRRSLDTHSSTAVQGNETKDQFSNLWKSPIGRRAPSPNDAPRAAGMRSPQRVSWSPSCSSAVGTPTSSGSSRKSPFSPSTHGKRPSLSPTRSRPPSPKSRRPSLYGANSVRRSSVTQVSPLDSSLVWGKLNGSSGTLSTLTCDLSTPNGKSKVVTKQRQGMPTELPLSRKSPGNKRHSIGRGKHRAHHSSESDTSQTRSSTTISPTREATTPK
jgi:hypothetical protein